ncbi:MAG: aldo/keto reductase [Spirochaetaceae bacterium]|jgi:predicted aldo/keto reductase-like oxidoreductase|nr:aldo/keto reductase [Spirochaetaceae bacterium]
MQYRKFGKTGIQLSALGLGTNRFRADTSADIEAAAELVQDAVEKGVNYIDVADTYSKGAAFSIVKEALKGIRQEIHATVKVSYTKIKTAGDTLLRTREILKNLGLSRASFFVVWSITSFEEYKNIIKEGSLYDGALRAKREGLIDHICFSTHAPPDDIVKIMEDGRFEGVTISYSVLNQLQMQPVLKRAGELDIGVVTMNSLGGGLIPQNNDFFSFVKQEGDSNICEAALRYSFAHPQITCMLSGMAERRELEENIAAFLKQESFDVAAKRIFTVDKRFSEIEGFCTGCRYCAGCPQNIDTGTMMQAYNAIYFTSDTPAYKRTGRRLLENINICKKLKQDFAFVPPDTVNLCADCGNCEEQCTQAIPIRKRLDELYKRFDESGFSRRYYMERLREIFHGNYEKIAFYPGGGYTALVLSYLKEAFPDLRSKVFLFDSNEKLFGTLNNGIEILNPVEIAEIKPDIIVISNFIYQDDIYNAIKHFEKDGIKIVKLHKAQDVPWVF